LTGTARDRDGLARALELHRAGRIDEAEAAYRALLTSEPGRADAWHLLAMLLNENARREEAAAAIAKAVALAPADAMPYFTRGTIALARNDTPGAIAAFDAALARNPQFCEAATNLGLALAKAGRLEDAQAAHRRAVAINPKYAIAYYNLGQVLHRAGRTADAIAEYRAAIAVAPDYLPAHLNLAIAHRQRGDLEAAEAAYRHASTIAPKAAEPWLGIGLVRKDRADHAGAIDAFGEALRRNPSWPEANLNLSLALLTLGRFAEAWPHYARRWEAPPLVHHRRKFAVPAWDGGALGKRRLLVHAEQGLGDTIQFAHLLRELDADPAQVVFEMPAMLLPLMKPFGQYATLLGQGSAIPPVDCHAPLMDLPRLLGVTAGRIRPMTGVLAAEPARVERWRATLANRPGRLVALCWRGGDDNPENARRSIDPALLQPLFEWRDLRLVSLQRGTPAPHPDVFDPGAALDPAGEAFLDSAAILTLADAVVTVDTSIAHLAGALGRPTWLLLPLVADWRWLTGRSDCPWYPSVTLARQAVAGNWPTAITQAVRALGAGPGS
jgi:tetratricopeptide (TPR) repeat protein